MMNCVPAQKFAKNDNVGQFLESANNTGVIYFSFGSLIQGSKMPEGLRKNLVNVFAKLKPMKVLWKWETEQMPDKPDNVMLSKWLPQQDVLGHSNVKLFLSHGGQSSFQESLCHKKPMVYFIMT
jgi:glucuronosyltransferase